MVTIIMPFTDLSLGVFDFEALEPISVCPKMGYSLGKSHVFIQAGKELTKLHVFI